MNLNISIILSDKFSRILKFVDERENKYLLFRLINAEQQSVLPKFLAVNDASKVFARFLSTTKNEGFVFNESSARSKESIKRRAAAGEQSTSVI